MLPSGQQKRNEQQDKFPNNSKPYSKAAAKEARRSRGEIACAECRRLKVRCNRQVPCATCISRGCAALCPNGTLPPGDNSRFVTHATDHLQRLIGKMTDRMRALEDALAIAQAAESSQTHPLLSVEATQDIDVDINQEEEDEPETVDSVVESFGTLHIEDKGRTQRFFGPSGGSESLLINTGEKASLPGAHEDVGPIDLRALGLPQELDPFFHAFPLTPMAVPTAPMWNILRGFLPLRDRAEALGRIMLERLSWMFSTVSLRVYVEELLPYVYSSKEITSGDEDTSPYHGAHGFALFLIVLAIGSLMDPTLPPYNADAQRYYAMSVVALGLEPILARPNLSTVKTLHLVSIYCGMSGSESNMANQYAILNLACSVAQTIGLHVDPVHWNMSEKDVYDRRCCYWNILRADLWQSIYSGRPPALALTVGNCKMQTEHDEEKYQAHEYTIGFGVWGSRYSERCLLPAMKLLVASKQPTYEAVLRLDKEIVAFEQPSPDLHFDSPSIAESMRWFVRSHYKELIRLALHRGFFAQALASDDSSPLDSPYKLSFLTAYASACTVLNSTSISYSRHPDLLSRVWMIWSFGFSSAVIVGAVAARCKNLNISPPPFQALQDACTLFERASKTNSRAAVALPVILSLREKAMHLHNSTSSLSAPSTELQRKGSWSNDEIDILRGKARLIESPSTSAGVTPDTTPPPAPSVARRDSETSASPANVPYISRTSSHSYSPVEHPTSSSLASWGDMTQAQRMHGYSQPHTGYVEQPYPNVVHQPAHIPQQVQHVQPVQQDWHAQPSAAPYYNYPHNASVPSPVINFNLEETWSNFLDQYGRLQ